MSAVNQNKKVFSKRVFKPGCRSVAEMFFFYDKQFVIYFVTALCDWLEHKFSKWSVWRNLAASQSILFSDRNLGPSRSIHLLIKILTRQNLQLFKEATTATKDFQ